MGAGGEIGPADPPRGVVDPDAADPVDDRLLQDGAPADELLAPTVERRAVAHVAQAAVRGLADEGRSHGEDRERDELRLEREAGGDEEQQPDRDAREPDPE